MKTITATNAWLQKNTKIAKYIEETEATKKADETIRSGLIQWTTPDNELFLPATHNVKQLKPGYYDIVESPSGLFFSRIKMGGEGLIKFPESNSDAVIDELERFWDREELFRKHKIAYKRGILLYGPPGSGKTSTIKILIHNLIKREGIVLKFSHPGLFSAGMDILRKIQPQTPVIVLMEDLDAILDRYNESDVINILDGVTGIDKVIFIGTTNYPEKLGSRIMNRPSRFDKKIEIGMPNAESRKIYLETIAHGELSTAEMDKWVNDTENLSISHLKELFVAVKILGDDYENAIATLKNMKVKINSSSFDDYGKEVAKSSSFNLSKQKADRA